MALTAADIEQAIGDLVMGRRVVKMIVAGKHMEFGQADLPQLRDMYAQKVQEETAATPARTSKGL